MKTFHCSNCNYLVFFENVRCEHCNLPLGFIPEIADVSAFDVDAARLWRRRPRSKSPNPSKIRSR
jgi:hypothetical protein